MSLAGVEVALAAGEVDAKEHLVCLITGVGFKDEASVLRMTGPEPTAVWPTFNAFSDAVRSAL